MGRFFCIALASCGAGRRLAACLAFFGFEHC
jgi:hypothetical protein